jgi:hypothetical protein
VNNSPFCLQESHLLSPFTDEETEAQSHLFKSMWLSVTKVQFGARGPDSRICALDLCAKPFGRAASGSMLLSGLFQVCYIFSTVWQFLKQLNMHLPYNLVISHLKIHSSERKVFAHPKTRM